MTTTIIVTRKPFKSIEDFKRSLPKSKQVASVDEASAAGVGTPFVAKNDEGHLKEWLWHFGFLAEMTPSFPKGTRVAVVTS